MSPLYRLLLAFGAIYLASLAGVTAIGLQPVIPWTLVPALLLIAVPFAVVFECCGNVSLQTGSRKPPLAILLCFSIAIPLMFHLWHLWIAGALAILAWPGVRGGRRQWKLLFTGVVILTLGYASLWNINYVLARFPTGPLHDPFLKSFDVWLYSLAAGQQVDYTGLFPLVRSAFLLRLLDNAYAILIPEILLVLMLESQTGDVRRVTRFVTRLFSLYVLGIVSFLLYPAIGPCLYYPESLNAGRARPTSINFVSGMLNDYRSAVSGGELHGFGYFIALPSLHVMVAILLQCFLYRHPVLFKLFLPINAAIILSTMLLGYHYALDLLVAAALYGIPGGLFLLVRRYSAAFRRYRTLCWTKRKEWSGGGIRQTPG